MECWSRSDHHYWKRAEWTTCLKLFLMVQLFAGWCEEEQETLFGEKRRKYRGEISVGKNDAEVFAIG